MGTSPAHNPWLEVGPHKNTLQKLVAQIEFTEFIADSINPVVPAPDINSQIKMTKMFYTHPHVGTNTTSAGY